MADERGEARDVLITDIESVRPELGDGGVQNAPTADDEGTWVYDGTAQAYQPNPQYWSGAATGAMPATP